MNNHKLIVGNVGSGIVKSQIVTNANISILSQKTLLLNDVNNEKSIEKRKQIIRNAYAQNDVLKNELLNNAIIDDMNDKMKHVIKLSDIDIDFELQTFYENCSRTNSKYTKALYMNNIREFQNYYGRNIIYANHIIAQQFLQSLINKQLAARTIRVKIASLSSFFTFLAHRYDCIKNIFFNLKLPKLIDKRELNVCTKNDINVLIKHMKQNGQNERALLIELMRDYGMRSGAFKNMRINNKKHFVTITKGREFRGVFNEKTIKKIENVMCVKLTNRFMNVFANINERTLQRYVTDFTRKLYKENKISCQFSCHDIRHYFAINYCEKHNKMNDLLKLKMILNHSSIDMTYNYLRSLYINFDE
jgi:site-specific recombinase XerD